MTRELASQTRETRLKISLSGLTRTNGFDTDPNPRVIQISHPAQTLIELTLPDFKETIFLTKSPLSSRCIRICLDVKSMLSSV